MVETINSQGVDTNRLAGIGKSKTLGTDCSCTHTRERASYWRRREARRWHMRLGGMWD